MQEKILEFLKKKPQYLSGDLISQRLGISRQALWKHIQELKEAGYDIEAVPHLGYRLLSCPDRLLPVEIAYQLNTVRIGAKIRYFEEVSSTMDVAARLGMEGAPDGTLVITETQTKGKGRLGRSWYSPKYKGLYFSLILRPNILPQQAPIVTLLCAVSICEAVKELTGITSEIKWPNDILLRRKKLGGILTELSAEMDAVRFAVVGIGLNVNNDKKTLFSHAASLKEEKGEPLSRADLLKQILHRIEDNYFLFQKKGAGEILEKWRLHNVTLGKRVRVARHNHHLEGLAADIDDDGNLLVRTDTGLIEKVSAGDVTLI